MDSPFLTNFHSNNLYGSPPSHFRSPATYLSRYIRICTHRAYTAPSVDLPTYSITHLFARISAPAVLPVHRGTKPRSSNSHPCTSGNSKQSFSTHRPCRRHTLQQRCRQLHAVATSTRRRGTARLRTSRLYQLEASVMGADEAQRLCALDSGVPPRSSCRVLHFSSSSSWRAPLSPSTQSVRAAGWSGRVGSQARGLA